MEKMEKAEIFIGARRLDEKEAARLLPNYVSIKETIKELRNSSKSEADESNRKEHNNTISILGKRGTGKTSILYTLKASLEHDIVLPIIKPDNQSEHHTVLSNVLGQLKTIMDSILNEIQKNHSYEANPQKRKSKDYFKEYFKECHFVENNPLKKAFIDMYEYYCYKEDIYEKILVDQYNNFANYAEKSSRILNSDEMFVEHFHKFIDILLSLKERLNKNSSYCDDDFAPMIFIFIDDIDLRSTKVHEVIDVLLSYVNHPRVVCLISADYDSFVDSFLMSLLRKEGLNDRISIYVGIDEKENSIFSKKKHLAHDYIKKIMPPAFRYEIATMNPINRAEYTFYTNDKANPQMMELFWALTEGCKNNENIFYYNDDSGKTEPLPYFFCVLDSTSRGLVNVYYHLYNAVYALMNNTVTDCDKFILVKNIVDTIINSSTKLLAYKEKIYKEYIIWGNSAESSRLEFTAFSIEKLNYFFELFNIMYLVKSCVAGIKYDEKQYNDSFAAVVRKICVEIDIRYYVVNVLMKGNDKQKGIMQSNYQLSLNIIHEYSRLNKLYDYSQNEAFESDELAYYVFYKAIKRTTDSNTITSALTGLFENNDMTKPTNILYYMSTQADWYDNGRLWLKDLFDVDKVGENKERNELVLKSMINHSELTECLEKIEEYMGKDFEDILKDKDADKDVENNADENDPYKKIQRKCKSIYSVLLKYFRTLKKVEEDGINEPTLEKIRKKIYNYVNEVSILLNRVISVSGTHTLISFGEKSVNALEVFTSKDTNAKQRMYRDDNRTVYNTVANIIDKYRKKQVVYSDYIYIKEQLRALSSKYDIVYGASAALKAYNEILIDKETKIDDNDALSKLFKTNSFKYFVKLYLLFLNKEDKESIRNLFLEAKKSLAFEIIKAKEESMLNSEAENEKIDLEGLGDDAEAAENGLKS